MVDLLFLIFLVLFILGLVWMFRDEARTEKKRQDQAETLYRYTMGAIRERDALQNELDEIKAQESE